MDHNEYIKRIIKHFSDRKNPLLYEKKFLGSQIQNMKIGKKIDDDEISDDSEKKQENEWVKN
jgi:hypothetical protein